MLKHQKNTQEDLDKLRHTFFVLPSSLKAGYPGLKDTYNLLVMSNDYQLTEKQLNTIWKRLNEDARMLTGRDISIFSRYYFYLKSTDSDTTQIAQPKEKKQRTTADSSATLSPFQKRGIIQIKIEDAIAWQPGLYLKFFTFEQTHKKGCIAYKININVTHANSYRLRNFANALEQFLQKQAPHLPPETIECFAMEETIYISVTAHQVFLKWKKNLSEKDDNREEFLKNEVKIDELIDESTPLNVSLGNLFPGTSTTSNLYRAFTAEKPTPIFPLLAPIHSAANTLQELSPGSSNSSYSLTPITSPSFFYQSPIQPIQPTTHLSLPVASTATHNASLPSVQGWFVYDRITGEPYAKTNDLLHAEESSLTDYQSSVESIPTVTSHAPSTSLPSFVPNCYVNDVKTGSPGGNLQPQLQNNSISSEPITSDQLFADIEKELDEFIKGYSLQ